MKTKTLNCVILVAALSIGVLPPGASAAEPRPASSGSGAVGVTSKESSDERPPMTRPPIKGCSTTPWRYDSTSRGVRKLTQFGPTQANRNRTGAKAKVTLTSQLGGTVTAAFFGSTNVKGSVKLAEISGEFGISAGLSITASVGNSITFVVPSGKTGYGKYGVWSLPVLGKEYRFLAPACALQSRATKTVAPFRVGWDVYVK